MVSVVINNENYYQAFTYTEPNGEPFAGFFKKIITGRITLYRYNDRYFVVKIGDKLREITKARKMVTSALIGDDYSGLGVMRTMISDCSSTDEQFLIDQYVRRYPDYRAVITTYNKCFPEGSIEIPDIIVKSRVNFGIQGGVNMAQLDFSRTNTLSQATFKWATSSSGGVILSLFTHNMGDRLRLNIEPSVGYYHGYSNFTKNNGVNDLFIKYTFVRMPFYARYYFRDNLFVDVGVTNMAIVSHQTTWRIESTYIGGSDVYTSDGPGYRVKSGMLAAMAGLGARIEIGGMPVFLTARGSSIFRPIRDLTATQPIVRWLDFNVALQLTGK